VDSLVLLWSETEWYVYKSLLYKPSNAAVQFVPVFLASDLRAFWILVECGIKSEFLMSSDFVWTIVSFE
jgi:hypothetical protein